MLCETLDDEIAFYFSYYLPEQVAAPLFKMLLVEQLTLLSVLEIFMKCIKIIHDGFIVPHFMFNSSILLNNLISIALVRLKQYTANIYALSLIKYFINVSLISSFCYIIFFFVVNIFVGPCVLIIARGYLRLATQNACQNALSCTVSAANDC